MIRNLVENPYSEDEVRVKSYFDMLGVEAGPDPIGLLIESHRLLTKIDKLPAEVPLGGAMKMDINEDFVTVIKANPEK